MNDQSDPQRPTLAELAPLPSLGERPTSTPWPSRDQLRRKVKPPRDISLGCGENRYDFRMSTRDRELPPEQAERVIDAMRDLLAKRFEGKKSLLARALGRSAASVGDILNDPASGPSFETARRVAGLLGITVDALLEGGAVEHQDDACPERARALVRLRGLLAPEVEQTVRSIVVHDDRPLDEAGWVRIALMHQDEWRRTTELRRLHGPNGPKRARSQ